MDLSRKTNLTSYEKMEIGAALHAKVLDELFRATRWKGDEAIFHGGTSLSLARRSPRFSQDLDFMINSEYGEQLIEAMRRILAPIQLSFDVMYPGCSVASKGPNGKSVSSWMFTWSHPNRHGVAKVKAEFLMTKPKLLKAYKSTHVVPMTKGVIGITTPLPVPTLVAAWADKVKAIATRPAMKWRDLFDLDYIANEIRYSGRVSDEEKIDAIVATAAIYDKTMEDVLDGLRAVVDSGDLSDYESFGEDMEHWFDANTYDAYGNSGIFRDKLDSARREIEGFLNLQAHLDLVGGR